MKRDEQSAAPSLAMGTDASPKERFVWHSAGLDGDGGSSYIDQLMLRDRDANTAWHSASDGTLEERVYTVHNWRSDAVARVSAAGKMLEWVTYTPYGLPRAMPAGDTDSDGDWDAADAIAVAGGYDVRKDADLDGTVDSNDVAHASSITGGYQTLGFAVLSSAAIGATRGYAGYQALPELARTMWHVRHRVLDSELGRWTRRDPLGYVDGMGLYEYVKGMALRSRDSRGTMYEPCPGTCADQPDNPPVDCNKCASEASREPRNAALIAEMRRRGCPVSWTCRDCGDDEARRNWKGWTESDGTIVLCANRMPSCEYVKAMLAHELWHSYDICQRNMPPHPTCCDCVCLELRAYRWDGGCKDGGVRRHRGGPNGEPPPQSERECLALWVGVSCLYDGGPCSGQNEFSSCFANQYDRPECTPQSVDPPPPPGGDVVVPI